MTVLTTIIPQYLWEIGSRTCLGYQNLWMLKSHSHPSISADVGPMDTKGRLYISFVLLDLCPQCPRNVILMVLYGSLRLHSEFGLCSVIKKNEQET